MENVKIAVVESDEMIRSFVVDLLTYCINRQVLSFEGSESAWAYFEENADIDIFVLEADLHNGLELISKIKQKDTEKICVAMSSNPEDEISAVNLGADAFLAKPFNMDDLFNVVQTFVTKDVN